MRRGLYGVGRSSGRRGAATVALLAAAGALIHAGTARAQDQVGHKLLGTLGPDAAYSLAPAFTWWISRSGTRPTAWSIETAIRCQSLGWTSTRSEQR